MKNIAFILFWGLLAEGAYIKGRPSVDDSALRLTDTRIVGGSEVDIARHHHQISLRVKNILFPENPYRHSCGGSIIRANYILTAAHCIITRVASQLHIVAGSNNRRGNDGIVVPVHMIYMHENYNPNTFDNDVALLKLDIPLPLDNYTIGAIELTDEKPNPGMLASVTGWGAVKENGAAADTLQEVSVPIISNSLCSEDYGPNIGITESMICAGKRGIGGKDSCQGDSGGPLVVNKKLAGVVSWGYGCARPEYPGVYANVAYFKKWINETIDRLDKLGE